ncbi:MAG: aldehyde dehydrogenase family protein [Spirochaetales bacterium]|nr:aldehyde dehydrogenase family protein [Spirochaetales bacterium]
MKERIELSRRAQGEWKNLSLKERARRLKPLGRLIHERADRISDVISETTGKTGVDALGSEVLPSSLAVGFYCRQAPRYLRPRPLKGGSVLFFNKQSSLYREPYGVIGIISPWNYPFAIPFQEVVMVLIAGNSCLLKVARQCVPVGEEIARLMETLDLPKGLFQLVNLPGAEAGNAFIESGMDKLFFTGSNPVGIELAIKAAERLMPLSLELGGNDAMIVLKGANLERAAAGACWAGFSNCGQSCGGVERIFVEEEVYEEFATLLRKKVTSLTQKPWNERSSDLGALTTKKQLETVKSHVADALAKGAVISARSGEEPQEDSLFYPATLLEQVKPGMITMDEETFGPVLALCRVKDGEEALKLANQSHLGLTGSIWTKNTRQARYYAARLEAGAITINDHLMSHGLAETPWGGYKQSSVGRSHGTPGLDEVTQSKVVIHDSLGHLPRQMWWYPHSTQVYRGLRDVMALVFGPKRLKGLIGTIRIFLRSFSSR